jgi:hypothetical protein
MPNSPAIAADFPGPVHLCAPVPPYYFSFALTFLLPLLTLCLLNIVCLPGPSSAVIFFWLFKCKYLPSNAQYIPLSLFGGSILECERECVIEPFRKDIILLALRSDRPHHRTAAGIAGTGEAIAVGPPWIRAARRCGCGMARVRRLPAVANTSPGCHRTATPRRHAASAASRAGAANSKRAGPGAHFGAAGDADPVRRRLSPSDSESGAKRPRRSRPSLPDLSALRPAARPRLPHGAASAPAEPVVLRP